MATPDLSAYGLSVRPAGKQHARLLGKSCRLDDRAAILSQGGWTEPERYARAQMNRSAESWAIYQEKSLLGVVGILCVPRKGDMPGYQYPWWLLSEKAEDATLQGAALTLVDSFRDRYPLLIGMVRASDAKCVAALQALGFAIMAPAKFSKSIDLWCKAVLDTRRIEVARG